MIFWLVLIRQHRDELLPNDSVRSRNSQRQLAPQGSPLHKATHQPPLFSPLSPSQSFFCDALRFVSALAVACHHILGRLGFTGYVELANNGNTSLGSAGVAAFFVLSGFLITHTVLRKTAHRASYDFSTFLIERACRIYVVFLPVMLLAPVIGAVWMPAIFTIAQGSLERWLTNLFMLCDIWPSAKPQAIYFLMIPSWTLNYEFFFYLMFGLVALPFSTGNKAFALRLAVLFAATFLVVQTQFFWLFSANWLMGAIIALAHQRYRTSKFSYGLIPSVILLCLYLYAVPHFYGAPPYLLTFIVVAIFGFLIFAFGSVPISNRAENIAELFAGYSYSLYLTHIITLSFMTDFYPAFMQRFVEYGGRYAGFAIALLVVNLAAFGFAWLTERHTYHVRGYALAGIAKLRRKALSGRHE